MPVYTRKSRLGGAKRFRLLEHFVAGTTARAAAELVGVNRNAVNRFYLALRQIIAEEMEKATPLHREVEVGESYFGGRRKGKRGRGAAGKVPVFSLLKRGGRVYTLLIPNARAKTLMPILELPCGAGQHRLLRKIRKLRRNRRCDVPSPAYGSRQGFRCGKRL